MGIANSNNRFALDRFTVDPIAGNAAYTTIQSAINAVVANGSGTVYVNPGSYSEALIIPASGISIIGSSSPQSGAIQIIGQVTITNPASAISFQNIQFSVGVGDAFLIASNVAGSIVINFDQCNINAPTGNAINATTTGGSNYNINMTNCGVSGNSNACLFNGTLSLTCQNTTFNSGPASACFDMNGGSTVFVFNGNLNSPANGFILRNASDVVVMLSCFGGFGTEVFSFVAPGNVRTANNTFQCTAPSGFWATGAGTLLYSQISALGSSAIDPVVTQIPIFDQPSIKGFLAKQAITANQTLAVNNGYYVTSGALSLALPASSAVGDTIAVTLAGGTSWTLTQSAGQRISVSSTNSTTGAGGSVASTAAGDSLTFECTVANTFWQATSAIGNLTIV